MIRGISRQIIEVPDTGNVYYEKAYLIVRPEYASAERELLEREARKILKGLDAPSGMKRFQKKNRLLLWLLLAVAAAAAAAAICFFCF